MFALHVLPAVAQSDMDRCTAATPQFPQACSCVIAQSQAAGITGNTLSRLLSNDTGGIPVDVFQRYGLIYVQCIQQAVVGGVPSAPPTAQITPSPAPLPSAPQTATVAPAVTTTTGPTITGIDYGDAIRGPVAMSMFEPTPPGTWGTVVMERPGEGRVAPGVHNGQGQILALNCRALDTTSLETVIVGGVSASAIPLDMQMTVARRDGSILRQEFASGITVDGAFFLATLTPEMSDALRAGSRVTVGIVGEPALEFGLTGSNDAIGPGICGIQFPRNTAFASSSFWTPDAAWQSGNGPTGPVVAIGTGGMLQPQLALTCDGRFGLGSPIFGYGGFPYRGEARVDPGTNGGANLPITWTERDGSIFTDPLPQPFLDAMWSGRVLQVSFNIDVEPGEFTVQNYRLEGLAETFAALGCPETSAGGTPRTDVVEAPADHDLDLPPTGAEALQTDMGPTEGDLLLTGGARPPGQWGAAQYVNGPFGVSGWGTEGADGSRLVIMCPMLNEGGSPVIALGPFDTSTSFGQGEVVVESNAGTPLRRFGGTFQRINDRFLALSLLGPIIQDLRSGSSVRITAPEFGVDARYGLRGSSAALNGAWCVTNPSSGVGRISLFTYNGAWEVIDLDYAGLPTRELQSAPLWVSNQRVAFTCDRRMMVPVILPSAQGTVQLTLNAPLGESRLIDVVPDGRARRAISAAPLPDDLIAEIAAAEMFEVFGPQGVNSAETKSFRVTTEGFAEAIAELDCPAAPPPIAASARTDLTGQNLSWVATDFGSLFDGMRENPVPVPGVFLDVGTVAPTLHLSCQGDLFFWGGDWAGPSYALRMTVDGDPATMQDVAFRASRALSFADYTWSVEWIPRLRDADTLRVTLVTNPERDVLYPLAGLAQAWTEAGCAA
ncbi:MAG: hypothetical protein AAF689_07060 [Pseudomonadota bacterium]